MYLSEKDVRVIASNTRIGLTDEEIVAMTGYLNTVIESLKPITEYDLEGVVPTFHPIAGLANVMREDVVKPGLTLEEVFANAPFEVDGQFRIPPILGHFPGDGGDR